MKGARIGLGRTAEIFTWGDQQVLKLFFEWVSSEAIEHEAEATRRVHALGIPVPKVGGVIEVNGRQGILFERIEGPSMLEQIFSKPWLITRMARLLAELHAALHTHDVPELSSLRKQLERKIQSAPRLSPSEKEDLLDVLGQMPDDVTVCHGDFHPDNILMSSRGPVIIDWIDAMRGHPTADVARTSLLLQLGAPRAGTRGRWLIALLRARFHRAYLKRYGQLRPGVLNDLDMWRFPVTAARLSERVVEEQEKLLAIVRAALQIPMKDSVAP